MPNAPILHTSVWERSAAILIGLLLSWMAVSSAHAEALSAPAMTTVSGTLSGEHTWTEANSPYVVESTLNVVAGATLIIEPGVTVIVNPNVAIEFNRASLRALGTAEKPILITGATQTPGSWRGINMIGTVNEPSALLLDHVTIEYGGNFGTDASNLKVFNGSVDVQHSIFRHSSTRGLTVSLTAPVAIRDTTFNNNATEALYIRHGSQHDAVLANLAATNNGTNGVVYGSIIQESDFVFEAMGLPYILSNNYRVAQGATLTIQPGQLLQMDKLLAVEGRLVAQGTAGNEIRFTGIGTTPGSWQGLQIGVLGSVTSAMLDHVIIENGGMGLPEFGYNLRISDGAVVTMTNSIVRNSATQGIMLANDAETAPLVTLAQTSITDNAGRALVCQNPCHQTLTGLTATGNGVNGVVLRGNISGEQNWSLQGLPYVIEQNLFMYEGELVIDPGVQVLFGANANLFIDGFFSAVGTPDQPIRMKGIQEQSGWWQGIRFGSNAIVELHHCEVAHGGASTQPMLMFTTAAVSLRNCHLHDSSNAAIQLTRPPAAIENNSIERNSFGLRYQGSELVDARNNWWGDPSGPNHASNPNGLGDAVSNGVLFTPWLTSPTATGPQEIDVNVTGPGIFSPGETVVYRVFYYNGTTQPVQDAVVRLSLPNNADYVDNSGNGIFWSQRGQVFWKLGELAPGARGLLAVRVRYHWGLPDDLRDTVAAQIGGQGITPVQFEVGDYLSYSPRQETGTSVLDKAEVQDRRGEDPTLDALYDQAEADGYQFGSALDRTYSTGESEMQVTLLRRVTLPGGGQELEPFFISHQPGNAVGIAIDGTGLTVYRPGRGLRFSLQSHEWLEVATVQSAAVQGLSWSDCMINCIEEKLPGEVAEQAIKAIGVGKKTLGCVRMLGGDDEAALECSKVLESLIPGYGIGVELGTCNVDCENCEESGGDCDNPNCHCCKSDKLRCDADDWLYGFFGIDVIKIQRCNLETGQYYAEEVLKVCALCEKCVEGASGPICTTPSSSADVLRSQEIAEVAKLEVTSGVSDGTCDRCLTARDPNEIVGPSGDLLSGEWVTYTVHYENVGTGIAYDVFVVNPLSEHFDLTTLTLHDGADALLSMRTGTLYFKAGDLAPNGQAGSTGSFSYSVRLKSGLPSGTVVSNEAVVHFPSVPEETPTNVVTNLVYPLIALPQQLEATVGQPLSIQLGGREANNSPLTYALVEQPSYGTLSGALPNLTYTPAAHAGGRVDSFLFTVSNGTMTSRAAEVTIQVKPNPNDTQPPTILWTSPRTGEDAITSSTLFFNGTEQLYGPVIQIQFSEMMSPDSLVPANIQLLGPNGQPVAITLRYDSALDQAVLLMNEAPQIDGEYTVVVTTGVIDLVGNPLAQEARWSFRVTAQTAGGLFLPTVRR